MDPSPVLNSETIQQYLRRAQHMPDASSSSDQQPRNAASEVQAILAKHGGSAGHDDAVAGMLDFINTSKLATNKPIPSASQSGGAQVKWVQPSGPRRPGEGTENEEQGVIAADPTETGGIILRITLLAAGFIIGPSGTSIRDIMRTTGADIKSWTENHHPKIKRPCRMFVVEGDQVCVAQAVCIMTAAVDRYKELCEGRYSGQSVPRIQHVMGIDFSYQPPPRNVVPYAASLKAQPPRGKGGTDSLLTSSIGIPGATSSLPPLPPSMRSSLAGSNPGSPPADYLAAMMIARRQNNASTCATNDTGLMSGLSSINPASAAALSRGHSRTSSPGLEDPELAELAAKKSLAAAGLSMSGGSPHPDVAALAMAAAQQAAAQVYQQFAGITGGTGAGDTGPGMGMGGYSAGPSTGVADSLAGVMMGGGMGTGPAAGSLGPAFAGGYGGSGYGGGGLGTGQGMGPGPDVMGGSADTGGDPQLEVMKELMALASRQDSPAVAMWVLQQMQTLINNQPEAPVAAAASSALSATGTQPLTFAAAPFTGVPMPGSTMGSQAPSDDSQDAGLSALFKPKQGYGFGAFGNGTESLGSTGGLAHWGSAAGSELQRALSGFSLGSESSAPALAVETSELSLAHSPTGSPNSGGSPSISQGSNAGSGKGPVSGMPKPVDCGSSILPAFDRPARSSQNPALAESPVLPKSWSCSGAPPPPRAGNAGYAGSGADSGHGARMKMIQDPVVASPGRFRRIKKGSNKYYSTAWTDGPAGSSTSTADVAKYGVDVPSDTQQAADAKLASVPEVLGAGVPGYDSE